MPTVKDQMRAYHNGSTRKFGYFSTQHFKIETEIMTDNITPGHFSFPGISQFLEHLQITIQIQHKEGMVYHFLFDSASPVI